MRGRGKSVFLGLNVAAMIFVLAKAVFACSVCLGGSADDPANMGLRNAVLFLLAVVVVLLAFFAKFFLNIRKRAKGMLLRR